MRLEWQSYKHLPYEKELALREVRSLLGSGVDEDGALIPASDHERASHEAAGRLTYFSRVHDGPHSAPTLQARLEQSIRSAGARQATRYSVHGLHEYKGKFNPQVARALMNIFCVGAGARVIDPFCGSGTTLVEAAHLGASASGTDMNPLACYITEAKLLALRTPAAEIEEAFAASLRSFSAWEPAAAPGLGARDTYLSAWFDAPVLSELERLKAAILHSAGPLAPVLLTIASDLVRDYSLQEPQDLRIRRRKAPMPSEKLLDRLIREVGIRMEKLAAAQALLPDGMPVGTVVRGDSADVAKTFGHEVFDAAITSPPYAMALPYIDTQRLSLVWLGLASAKELAGMEAELVGSRETRGAGRRDLFEAMERNSAGLPAMQADLCMTLQEALTDEDGFRRQAVPLLLYRYFSSMSDAMRGVVGAMKPSAPFGLIVGHNHTTLGGTKFDIDTPAHLASLATSVGWKLEELMPLQTYRRYGMHAANAVKAETLVLLRRPKS